MSRFESDDYYEEFPNQGALWWANIERALDGRRGQAALRELESALLELPSPRLIAGHLACGTDVCAVGALVVRTRVSKGEALKDVLADLEKLSPPVCECGHSKDSHADGSGHCTHLGWESRPCWSNCEAFDLSEHESDDCGGDTTATIGHTQAGLAYSLAWRLGYLNDEDFSGLTPEQRYQQVLFWVRERLGVCTCGGRHTNVDGNGGHAVNCPVRTGITAVAA